MWTYNTVVVLTGAGLLGALGGVVGSFAVLRRRALLGDAVAHAALPGVALAFWLTLSRQTPVLLVGALASALFGVWVLAMLRRRTRTKEDAALALVLSSLFGFGVVLSRLVADHAPGGSQAGLDSLILGRTAGIGVADVALVGALFVGVVACVGVAFRPLRLATFDSGYAHTLGWSPGAIDFATMALVTLTVVVGLPMAGVVMVAALTILPPVIARFWTHHLASMLVVAGLVGFGGAVIGAAWSAQTPKTPTGPAMILALGAALVASALLAPERGLVASWVAERRRAQVQQARILLRQGRALPDRLAAAARRVGWLDAQGNLNERGREAVEGR